MKAPSTVAALVGRRIREARKSLGWSERALAERAGLSQPTINRIEHGYAALRFEHVEAIAKALGVPTSRFLPKRTPQLA